MGGFMNKPWGAYNVFYELSERKTATVKVKELFVEPKKSLSLQRHRYRSEQWMVVRGDATVRFGLHRDFLTTVHMQMFDRFDIPVGHWHQLRNDTNQELLVLEIQYGEDCNEDDIERL